jgi:hypothetical protein
MAFTSQATPKRRSVRGALPNMDSFSGLLSFQLPWEPRRVRAWHRRGRIKRTQPVRCLVAIFFLLICGTAIAGQQTRSPSDLDRVTYAVDGAESSHGNNPAMWRADPSGPQGPMQVSEKAASDAGGGNRFDMDRNRRLGRAYLGLLQRRYGNWADAISAYNWGMGRVDAWIKQGHRRERLAPGVAAYVERVLRDSGLFGTSSRPFSNKRHDDVIFLPGFQQSGLPLPRLAGSGSALPRLNQSGRPLPMLIRSGRPL